MLVTRSNGDKYLTYFIWDKSKHNPYKYNLYGILPKLMSSSIINTENVALKYILSFYDKTFIFLLKYIDELKNFKNFHWKNR